MATFPPPGVLGCDAGCCSSLITYCEVAVSGPRPRRHYQRTWYLFYGLPLIPGPPTPSPAGAPGALLPPPLVAEGIWLRTCALVLLICYTLTCALVPRTAFTMFTMSTAPEP